jgi:hypothetical protein
MSSALRAWPGLALLVSSLLGCQREKPPELVARASFGIFFGGQVQEREEIPFELDRSKQMQGFRIDFSDPLVKEVKIGWEIDRPAKGLRTGKRNDPERIVELGEAVARTGLSRFDQMIPFKPGDALGSWKVQVRAGDKLVIDRKVVIYDPAVRAREDDSGVAP